MRITSSRGEKKGAVLTTTRWTYCHLFCIRCLRIPLSNSAEGYHGSSPLLHHPDQPLLLLLSAPNEAAKVALPSRVVDVEAKAFEGLAGSVLVLGLANVVGFAGLGEVPVLWPKLHKEVKASSVGHCLAGRACVVAVPRLQGFGDRFTHPRLLAADAIATGAAATNRCPMPPAPSAAAAASASTAVFLGDVQHITHTK